MRQGGGEFGTDRVTIVWPDGAIENEWLQVRVLATPRTGLSADEVFFFGSAVGETGNRSHDALVTAADIVAVRDHQRGAGNRADIENNFDLNRDTLVDAADVLAARNGVTSPFSSLRSIAPTLPVAPPQSVPEPSALAMLVVAAGLCVCRSARRLLSPRTLACAGVLALMVSGGVAQAEPGLLLIAHGAPMPQWNAPVMEFGEQVAAEAVQSGKFKAARTAMLEFAKPDVPGAVAELEAEGCDRIVAVPLFIAPSGHTHFDVPAELGIYSSPSIKSIIAEEGGRLARPNVPITLAQTLAEGDMLQRHALSEVKRLSKDPANEAIVLLAHGCEDHHRMVECLMRRLTTYCCGQTGIDYGDWAFIEIGQSYATNGVGAIAAAAEQKQRVLVVGVYVVSSAESIHRRATAHARGMFPPVASLEGKNVVFSSRGVIAHPDMKQHVLRVALETLNSESDEAHSE